MPPIQYEVQGKHCEVTVEPVGDDLWRIQVGQRTFMARVRAGDQGRLDLEIDGRRLRAYSTLSGKRRYIALDGDEWVLAKPDLSRRRGQTAGPDSGELLASMPGRVLDVLVAAGDSVKKGDTLVLLEAMKMELRITAPHDGSVARTLVQAGQVVERNQILVELTIP